MFVHRQQPFDPRGGAETPEAATRGRRRFLQAAGIATGAALVGTAGYAAWRAYRGTDEKVLAGGQPEILQAETWRQYYPAERDKRFAYGRDETSEAEAARYTNFYEFSSRKSSWRLVGDFRTQPWTLTIGGLCRNELTFDTDELLARFARYVCERQYRHRCVETWAMAVPWTGIPLAHVIEAADPLPRATHVRFVSFDRPDEAPGQRSRNYPWPYTEGLRLDEATCELTLLATGMYGHPLLKQHGAPVRLVVPWKYGFKSIKSIERIELVDGEPATFWTTLMPQAYPFESNVEPDVPRPWPQHTETMLGSGEVHPTALFNGYAEYVANLYPQRRL